MENRETQTLRTMLRDHINEQKEYNKKFDRIINIILGDPEANVEGIIHKINKHEIYISNDKKIKWMGAGIAATSGVGFWETIKHFFLK